MKNGKEEELVALTARRLHKMLWQYLNLDCTVGIGRGKTTLDGIRKACHQAVEAVKSHYFWKWWNYWLAKLSNTHSKRVHFGRLQRNNWGKTTVKTCIKRVEGRWDSLQLKSNQREPFKVRAFKGNDIVYSHRSVYLRKRGVWPLQYVNAWYTFAELENIHRIFDD